MPQLLGKVGGLAPLKAWRLIPVNEALSLIDEIPQIAVREVNVPVVRACNRVLAEDMTSARDVPAYPRAAVDGYALNSETCREASHVNPKTLKLTGAVTTGARATCDLVQNDEAVYITCGSQLPNGANSVVRLEEARSHEHSITVTRPLTYGENVDEKGVDVRNGETIVRGGQVLRTQDIALLAYLGKRVARTVRKPKVAVLPVGDELVEFGSRNDLDVMEYSSFIFSRLSEDFYATALRLKLVRDRVDVIATRIREACRECDLIITIGGSSVGMKDLVPEAISSLRGSEVHMKFHGVALFPGKPTGLAVVNRTPIIMLPGRIISALAGYFVFVIPVLSRITGINLGSWIPRVKAVTKNEIKAKGSSYRFEMLKLRRTESFLEAETLPKGSGLLSNFVKANGYVVVPSGGLVGAGEEVEVSLFSPREMKLL